VAKISEETKKLNGERKEKKGKEGRGWEKWGRRKALAKEEKKQQSIGIRRVAISMAWRHIWRAQTRKISTWNKHDAL